MSILLDEDIDKIAAMEFIRKQGGDITEQMEFAKFQVGFPRTMEIEQVYLSYIIAKNGPEQLSMSDQEER